jgi:hypothetical protein
VPVVVKAVVEAHFPNEMNETPVAVAVGPHCIPRSVAVSLWYRPQTPMSTAIRKLKALRVERVDAVAFG